GVRSLSAGVISRFHSPRAALCWSERCPEAPHNRETEMEQLAPEQASPVAASPTSPRAMRLLIALMFFGTIINYIDRQVLSLLKPTIEQAYGWGDAEFAHFASVSQL